MMAKAKRILLAEDEVALRDFVSRNLRARGFEVLEASNGLEALAVWEREDPHLLILDHIIRMGATDEELLAGIRAGGYTGKVLIGRDLESF